MYVAVPGEGFIVGVCTAIREAALENLMYLRTQYCFDSAGLMLMV